MIDQTIPQMFIEKTSIEGLLVIKRDPGLDNRGFFKEIYRESVLGFNFKPIQMNHSLSQTGVIRGIHAEKWNKLVYPLTGKTFVAIVDLRAESKTFGKHENFIFDCINEAPNKSLYIPNGLGNSICVISGPVNYIYAVDAYWTPDSSFAINPFDKDLGINWPVEDPIVTEKDKQAPTMRDRFPEKYK